MGLTVIGLTLNEWIGVAAAALFVGIIGALIAFGGNGKDT